MSRSSLLLTLTVFCTLTFVQAAAKDVIPAGTILQCTVDEPNFSSKTAQVGDPVLCHLGPLGSFGHSVFPRGAELGGHLEDFKNPGHFFGKGWMAIEFDRLILPGVQIYPLAAKVISAPHTKVDAQGDIRGKGHAKRDAVLWAIPPLWPIKVLTLPARGPFPALKGESRLSLRVMEDVEVPFAVAQNAPMPPWASPSRYQSDSSMGFQPALRESALVERVSYNPPPVSSNARVTVIALRAGNAVLVRQYWIEGGQMHFITDSGVEEQVALEKIDLAQTVKVNQERNVGFALVSRGELER